MFLKSWQYISSVYLNIVYLYETVIAEVAWSKFYIDFLLNFTQVYLLYFLFQYQLFNILY